MGLDQYLRADGKEIGYWRKHPDLHCHIEELWRERPGSEGDFNCKGYELIAEEMEEILDCSQRGSFGQHDGSTGFFFGSTDETHHQETIEIMQRALKLFRQGKRIVYSSWW